MTRIRSIVVIAVCAMSMTDSHMAFAWLHGHDHASLSSTAGSRDVDLSHAELATPECLGVSDVAVRHAFLRTAQRAQAAVKAKLPRG